VRVRFYLTILAVMASLACVAAQTPASTSAQKPTFDANRAFEHLKQVVAFGPRPANSPALQKTREYIKQQLTAIGLTPVEQAFEAQTPIGPVKMANISATIKGTGGGPGRLIIAGHYDTKLFTDFTFVGANDAGSSTAFLLEFARVLKDRKNAVTMEILFLDGEEAFGEWDTGNTWGSRYYVEQAEESGDLKNVKAMILVDMIGDKDLTIKRESQSTPWLTDAIWSAARQLKRPEFQPEEQTINDDHLPFLQAGVPAVDIIDFQYPDAAHGAWHTAEDTLDKVSAQSLQVVADVLLAALPAIELRVK
jgi:Zn-dependent M28 family amino/carboxypeptidase